MQRFTGNDGVRTKRRLIALGMLVLSGIILTAEAAPLREALDAPLLFTKRHSYQGIHIYDTYYQWYPGGGIYILENPWDAPKKHRLRAVIDANTPETLGEGMYTEPDISWDGTRILFCFKGSQAGVTGIYEIGLDGTGLRPLMVPKDVQASLGTFSSHHDISPAYLPDGRILFTSTRPNGLVPCNNTGVDIMHIMDADGGNVQRISVNNVNEFDPCVMPDGRILHGRWEYVDKTALTQQSLWSIFPDGSNETAVYANNLVVPEALLDSRPVPGASHLIATTLAKHNATPRGTIAIINTRISKNHPDALFNFDAPKNPTKDTGNSCEPWPLTENLILFSGRPEGAKRNVIQLVDGEGNRETVFADPDICAHSPMLLKPRPMPAEIPPHPDTGQKTGYFYVQDIYKGLDGVQPGEVKYLRVLEETSRTSETPGRCGKYNQTFLVSAALAFSVKNFLGIVPVQEDGSVHFEAPAGRALYFQALDKDGRLIQSMRTFIQAVPGATRSCIGCHEHKFDAPTNKGIRTAHRLEPSTLQPESWGSGFLDYPSMVQPVLDKHCVGCHGGEKGFAGKLDLSGGWTEHFNLSYENLVSRHENQMVASLISGIDCMNGTAHFSAQRFGARAHGSATAPLAKVLVNGHHGRINNLSRTERDLLLAWIDTNGLYYGTWDYTAHMPDAPAWQATKAALQQAMRDAGCMDCHATDGVEQFEDDWFNLRDPEMSRILRAPLAKGGDGYGLSLCQDRNTEPRYKRIRMLVGGNYAHAVQPLKDYVEKGKQPDPAAPPAPAKPSFTSTQDATYQDMLALIRKGRRDALSRPRIDMPGAEIVAGHARQFVQPPLPAETPALRVTQRTDGLVELSWERTAATIGLRFEVHRGKQAGFLPTHDTYLAETRGFQYLDKTATPGLQHYALVIMSDNKRKISLASLDVQPSTPPPVPSNVNASLATNTVALAWQEETELPHRYLVYRSLEGDDTFECLTDTPTDALEYIDAMAAPETAYRYAVRAVNKQGLQSAVSPAVAIQTPAFVREPMFTASFTDKGNALCYNGDTVKATPHGNVRLSDGALDLRKGGHLTYPPRPEFALSAGFSIAFKVKLTEDGGMPVIASCGVWQGNGWFLQKLGGGWRWYVGGINCDGGKAKAGNWIHLAATFDGSTARIYQDGQLVAEKAGAVNADPFNGDLHLGQYSGGIGDQYQTKGLIKDFKIYARVLHAQELQTQLVQR